MDGTWKKGGGQLGFLQPLLGRWTATAEGDVMGPVRCTRAFMAVLEGAYVRLEVRWELGGGANIYEEEALIGAGFKVNPFEFNVAYGEVWDSARTVSSGLLRPINGAEQGKVTDSAGTAYPAVNNGHYEGHNRVVSFGATMYLDGIIGKRRH